jgi:hypothetical protein
MSFRKHLPERLGLSELEEDITFPNYGEMYGPCRKGETKTFLAIAAKLVAEGAPQLTVMDVVTRYTNAICEKGYGPVRDAIDDGHDLYVCWDVKGVPSKQGKQLARGWMAGRTVAWDGKANSLRIEVERALCNGEAVPKFGFKIRCLIFDKRPH